MNLKGIFRARKLLANLKKDPNFSEAIKDKLTRNSLFLYEYISPPEDEYFVSLHNHSDSGCYTLEEMAKTAIKRKYDVFVVADHNMDIKFDGQRIRYYEFDGKGIFLVRGMECRCRLKDPVMKDILLIGYENGIRPFREIDETLDYCKQKRGIAIATSPFNEEARGLSGKQLEKVVEKLDAIETLNSSSSLGFLCCFDALAEEFAKEKNIPGVFVNDAHTLSEIGLAGIGIKKGYLKVLEKPNEILREPDLLIQGLKEVILQKKFNNYGNYIPKMSILYPSKFVTLSHKHAVLKPG